MGTTKPAVPEEAGPFSANEPPGSDVLPPLEQAEGENAKQERLLQEQGQDQSQQYQDQQQQSSEQNDRDTETSAEG
jgi:hypothetical protein